MASTGEVACFGEDAHEAFLQSMLSTSFKLPTTTKAILLSIASEEFRLEFAKAAVALATTCGFKLYGTPGTAQYYKDPPYNLDIISVTKPLSETDDSSAGSALFEIKHRNVDLAIIISEGTNIKKEEITAGYLIRRCAVDFGVSLVTDVKCAIKLTECFERGMHLSRPVPRHIEEYYSIPMVGWTK
jgi:MGS-like domain